MDASVDAAFGAEKARVTEESAKLLAEANGAADKLKEDATAEAGELLRKARAERAALEEEKASMVGLSASCIQVTRG